MKLTGIFSFLLLLLSTHLFASSDLALVQSSRPSKPEEFDVLNWRKNLRIGYFGDYSFTTLKKLDDNQYNSDGTKNRMPISLLNEFNISYNITPNLALYSKPEFYVVTGDRNDLDDTYDRNLVTMGDVLMGFQYRAYRGPKANYSIRVTHGHPFSKYSRDQNLKSETDFQNFIIWFPTRDITMLIWNTYRYYIYDSDVNSRRYRINNRFIFSYKWTDTWGYQFNSEYVLQHRAPKTGPRQRKWNHFSVYRNTLSWGVTYKLNNYLTIIPNVEAQDLENVKWETLQLGVTFLGRIF
ncbi:MAG TPA: hypothetical protein VKY27_03440 [Bacteriovoracaceae bacterium]|nr:hypothetical protein [Bacteriovoracaceae bacterium]